MSGSVRYERIETRPFALILRLSKGERLSPLTLRLSKGKRGDHVRLV